MPKFEIRQYRDDDLPALVKIHQAQGFDYPFPDPNQLHAAKIVITRDGKPVAALIARMTVEMYLLMSEDAGTPAEKLMHVEQLQKLADRRLQILGIPDMHCWIPPETKRGFLKRLRLLGWIADNLFTPFSRVVPKRAEPTGDPLGTGKRQTAQASRAADPARQPVG